MATLTKPDSTANLGITIESNVSNSRLADLGIKSWPKYGCPPGKYSLKFDAEEICYYVKGKIKAYPKGSTNYIEFGAGDLVTIPKGFSCILEVLASVDKYYMFEASSSSSS